MVDIHCHILSGMDDGAKTPADSLAMAEMAIADGITHVVGTPHASSEYAFNYAAVRRAANDLRTALGERLHVATGCDFHLSPENLQALRLEAEPFCINQKDYLLVEFNEFSIPPAVDETLYQIQLMRLRPILTHPERNAIIRAQPERLEKWVRNGCFAQVTGGALLGAFGPGPQETSLAWIGRGLIHFVASDAHNTSGRPHKLRAAYEAVRDAFGEETAEALFVQNPLAAFEGRPLPHVPEIFDEPKKKRRFLFF